MLNKWTVQYYHNRRGDEVARDEIRAFGAEGYARILTVIGLLEDYGLAISGKFTKHIEGKIWEIRVDRYRVLYFTGTGRRIILLRAFAKKTDKTPAREIRTAWNRLHGYLGKYGR